jgi:PKD repeat protein
VTATNVAGTGPASSASAPVTPTGSGVAPLTAFYGTPTGSNSSGGGPPGSATIVGLPGVIVAFTNLSTGSGPLTAAWTFGDGGTSITSSPTHVYSTQGTFNVTLTMTNPNGSTALPKLAYVLVGCQVPNFANVKMSNATGLWTAAGFTGAITILPAPPGPGPADYKIGTQTLPGGQVNPTGGCGATITVGP